MPFVRNRLTGDIKGVKNLGWLLSHAGEVRNITVTDAVTDGDKDRVLMQAVLNEHIFRVEFADKNVCKDWLKKRRSMRGVKVNFLGEAFTI